MSEPLTRRGFVAALSAGASVLPLGIVGVAQAQQEPSATLGDQEARPLPPGFPSHDPTLAREVVGKSHSDLETVKRLVERRPALARAVWDWGFGDWESALGAASHVGRRDIAELLMAHGARADIFTFAMLGNLAAVKAIIADNPGIQRAKGPHGIPLLAHAKAGKEQAAAVAEYLESLGDAGERAADAPLDAALRAAMLGEYDYLLPGTGQAMPGVSCAILEQRGTLQFKHAPDGSARNLVHLGDGQFHPVGSPDVRIAFKDGLLNISDGDIAIGARRRS